LIATGGLPFAAAFLAYNRQAMGSFLHLAYNVTGPSDRFGFGWRASFEVPGGGHDGQLHYTVGRAVSTLGHLFVVLPRFVAFAPVVIALVALAVWSGRRDLRLWLLVAMMTIVAVGCFSWWGVANSYHFELDRSLGPFYYYPLLVPLCVLAAWGAVLIRRSIAIAIVMTLAALAWGGVASAIVVRDARDAGHARSVEVEELRAPAPSLVLEAPLFPNDPYLRVATDTMKRTHLVAVDVPGRRLELIDRFPGRALYLVRTYRRFGDFLGAEQHDRVALSVVRGREINARVHVRLAAGRAGSVYVRIGTDAPRFAVAGRRDFVATVRIPVPAAESAHATLIAVGVTLAEPGGRAPTAMTDNWFECRTEARTTARNGIEALQLCDGRHHYTFANGASVIAVEDISPALQVVLASS
jgi:hypothetical protein